MEHPRVPQLSSYACSKEQPCCTACLQGRRPCSYSGKIIRSPLTRAYLTSVEKRLQSLERLVAERLPEVNIDEVLASPRVPTPTAETQQPRHVESDATSGHAETESEAVPTEADGYDWKEAAASVHGLADGMAALKIDPTGSGYLGSTAGAYFLRSMLFWLGNPEPLNQASPTEFEQALVSSQLSQSILSHQVVSRLMDGYFTHYHPTYPFVHEATFRAQFHEVIPRPQHRAWQMLFHTILALGAWCLGDNQPDLDDYLYHCALSFGEDESLFESANLTFVQALVLLSNLSQKRNKPNTGGNFLGLATRMATSLGLHRELPEWNISPLQRQMRCRVWWGLYIFDSGASTTFGRPILLPGRDAMDIKPVLNVPDDALTPKTTVMPPEPAQPTIYSGLKAQSDFHLHTNYISNRLLSPAGVSTDEALAMNQALDAWSKTLPVYFQLDQELASTQAWYVFARSRLWWRFWNLKIILFRQILLKRAVSRTRNVPAATSHKAEAKCRDICVEAAHSTVLSIQDYLEQAVLTRLAGWYSMFFLFHAALVITLAILGDCESDEFPKWQTDIGITQSIFGGVLAGNPLAKRCADILDSILPLGRSAIPGDRDFDYQFNSMPDTSMWASDIANMFGVVSGVLTMESFAARFPRIYTDGSFKGWFVSTLLLLAWVGSLINGPLADRFGRKGSMLMAVCVFVVGSAIQAGAVTVGMLFAGRAIAGLAVGMLTMIVPMYMSEVSTPAIRGTLVVLQQLSITIGILISYWLEYGTQFIGGTRCAPNVPYTGGTPSSLYFDPYADVGPDGCTGQSEGAWRVPFALQILPALALGIGMLFYPESPRYYAMRDNEEKALAALTRLRRAKRQDEALRREYLEIKTEVLFDESVARDKFPGKTGFMGCNAMIYYAPTIFAQLGLSGNTTSLLATGVYGIVNTLSTLPALFLIDLVGRRPLLMCGALGTFVSLVIVGAIIGAYGASLPAHQAAGWVGVAFIYIYDINFSYSIGWGTYIFFAAFCLIALAFTFFFVPETKGKSLEEMDVVFGDVVAQEEKTRLFDIAASVGLTEPIRPEKLGHVGPAEVEEMESRC
ncbi:regulatory protein GAL4 [Achaetomium macrosporum]|uniref:Regulatory protein GAL4 n=1 Tax=Achaetomium macrosporum TaxID=79813 RepID=A0AAN7C399_9PEZI|nr:regulatory protein GAL4 [Achaetomium macrosporum]